MEQLLIHMDGWMDGWMDGLMVRCTDRHTCKCIDGWMMYMHVYIIFLYISDILRNLVVKLLNVLSYTRMFRYMYIYTLYIYIYVSCIRMCVYMYEYVHIRAGTKIAKQHSKLQQEQTNIQSSHMFLSMLV